CAAGPDESGKEALDWSLEALVQDGDELIACRGVDEDYDPDRKVCVCILSYIQLLNKLCARLDSQLTLILEYIPTRITATLDRLTALYRPNSVVVGTRGKKVRQGTW
ncbi:hypothetical protein C8R43DRAFT_825064, partial [Mycena crocata]